MGVTLQIEFHEADIARLQAQATQQRLSLGDFVVKLVQAAETVEPDVALDDAQERVHKSSMHLSENFDNLSHRLSAGVQLQTALCTLEAAARNANFRLLARVSAVLHDALKHNPIEGFSKAQLTAYDQACQEAIKDPSMANPLVCERHLFHARLSWLPPLPDGVLDNHKTKSLVSEANMKNEEE